MIKKIDHIGIAVTSCEEQISFYRDVLKLTFLGEDDVEEQGVHVAMFQAGDVKIELLEPLREDSPIARFLAKHGTGIHHIAYETDSIEEEIENMVSNRVCMIHSEPQNGAHGTKIAFIHPRSSGGILTEICQSGGHES